ncbi:MAG: DUF4332 domain-containing protein [Chthonomonas sp.]|nr:DUF4332 domain-containing protein [Chthonomonas sp.]
MANIKDIEGIGPAFAEKLAGMGIITTDHLLEKGAGKSGRDSIAEGSGISDTLILKWVNRADLARVHGIGSEYADLLEASGVDSVPELAQRNAANLHAKMEEVNAEKSLVRSTPSLGAVEKWVEEAKSLDRVVTH